MSIIPSWFLSFSPFFPSFPSFPSFPLLSSLSLFIHLFCRNTFPPFHFPPFPFSLSLSLSPPHDSPCCSFYFVILLLFFSFPLIPLPFSLFLTLWQTKPHELLDKAWNGPEASWKAPHLIELIERVNNLSLWVASIIVFPSLPKQRKKHFQRLLSISHCLVELHNYSSAFAFLGGLNNPAVTRLKSSKRFHFFFFCLKQKTTSLF